MPVPKFRTSASKRDMRRSHHALKAPASCLCTNCGEVRRPHTVCAACGFYKGRQILNVVAQSTSWNGEGLEPDSSLATPKA
jgi:large subunit ribosomal protein L32